MVAVYCAQMTGQPRANRDDRTSLVVGIGMVTLLIVGVASVFGNTIAAAFAPAAASSPEITRASGEPAAVSTTGPAIDAGGTKS